jgi:hypothetical protein
MTGSSAIVLHIHHVHKTFAGQIRALGVGQVEKELSGLAVPCNSDRALLTIWSLGYVYRVRSM